MLVEGTCLVHRMNAGAFGKFRGAIEKLDVDWSAFTLPKIVVVGTESAGKSSLIENITKCAVFPRSKDICTKVPVCFELKTGDAVTVEVERKGMKESLSDRNKIRTTIKGMFDELGEDVSEDQQIIVRVTAPDAPTLTLIDLPGIRTYPQNLACRTRALSERYLTDPDTLVICVVQATDRLTGNNAVALTTEKLGADAKTRAILVLTKPDIVANSEWEEKVVARLQGTSAELRGIAFANCVAVASRPQNADGSERMELAQVDVEEMDWWTGGDKLPKPLLQKVGVQNLITIVDGVFAKHIAKEWKPRALKTLQGRQQQLKTERQALGPEPSTLTGKQVRDDVASRLAATYNAWSFHFERLAANPNTCSGHNWNWVASSIKLTKAVEDWSQRLLDAPQLLEGIRGIVTKAFEDGATLKTKRFVKMRDELIRIATEEFNKRKPDMADRLDRLVSVRLDDLSCKVVQTEADLQAIERGVLRLVNHLLTDSVWATSWVAAQLSLEECQEVKEERARYNDSLARMDSAMQTIQGI